MFQYFIPIVLLILSNILFITLWLINRKEINKIQLSQKSEKSYGIDLKVNTNSNNELEIAHVIQELILSSSSSSEHSQFVSTISHDFHDKIVEASDFFDSVNKEIQALQYGIEQNTIDMTQTSAAIEEITASIGSISNESQKRYKDLSSIVFLMNQGKNEMEVTKKIINQTTAGIGALLDFIKMIDEIASRTSILSMNAAIQAAHAGEAGKGFAVVAHEVRRLAETTSQNASGISQKLKSLIESITLAEQSSEKTVQILSTTGEKLKATADSFLIIDEGTKELFIGSQDIMKSTISLNETGRKILNNSESIVQSSDSVLGKLDLIKSRSIELKKEEEKNYTMISDLNFNVLSLAQLQTSRLSTNNSDDNAALFSLQLFTWITKLRAFIDKKIRLDRKSVHENDMIKVWLDKNLKNTATDLKQFKQILNNHTEIQSIIINIIELINSSEEKNRKELFDKLIDVSKVENNMIKNIFLDSKKNTDVLSWSDSLSVGNKTIDDQHKRLVQLVNSLNKAVVTGTARNILGEILLELVQYTVKHFTDEEKIFMNTQYPHKTKHLEEHKKLTQTASDLVKSFSEGNVLIGSDTIDFLKNWLVNHIMGTDKGYSEFIN